MESGGRKVCHEPTHLFLTRQVEHLLRVGRVARHGLLAEYRSARVKAHDTVLDVTKRRRGDVDHVELRYKVVGSKVVGLAGRCLEAGHR